MKVCRCENLFFIEIDQPTDSDWAIDASGIDFLKESKRDGEIGSQVFCTRQTLSGKGSSIIFITAVNALTQETIQKGQDPPSQLRLQS
jgi:hypothetical protein